MMTMKTSKARRAQPLSNPIRRSINEPGVAIAVPDDLSALVRAIMHGDECALLNLYNHSVGKTYSLAFRIVRSKECAQEVVCDVFFEVWRKAHVYDPRRGSVQAWLNVITRNRAIDRLRGNLRHVALSQRVFSEEIAMQIPQPEELLSSLQECSSVHVALSQLSPLRQMFVGLSFVDGFSHEEIAAIIGVPLGTVKSHVRRALLSLREALGRPVDRRLPSRGQRWSAENERQESRNGFDSSAS